MATKKQELTKALNQFKKAYAIYDHWFDSLVFEVRKEDIKIYSKNFETFSITEAVELLSTIGRLDYFYNYDRELGKVYALLF